MVSDGDGVEVRGEVIVVDVVTARDELRVRRDDRVLADGKTTARIENAAPADVRACPDPQPLDAEHRRSGEQDAAWSERCAEAAQPPLAEPSRRQVSAVTVEEDLTGRADELALARPCAGSACLSAPGGHRGEHTSDSAAQAQRARHRCGSLLPRRQHLGWWWLGIKRAPQTVRYRVDVQSVDDDCARAGMVGQRTRVGDDESHAEGPRIKQGHAITLKQ